MATGWQPDGNRAGVRLGPGPSYVCRKPKAVFSVPVRLTPEDVSHRSLCRLPCGVKRTLPCVFTPVGVRRYVVLRGAFTAVRQACKDGQQPQDFLLTPGQVRIGCGARCMQSRPDTLTGIQGQEPRADACVAFNVRGCTVSTGHGKTCHKSGKSVRGPCEVETPTAQLEDTTMSCAGGPCVAALRTKGRFPI